MGLLEDLASIILNSKSVPELTLRTSAADTDYVPFFNTTTAKLERILASNFRKNASFASQYFGAVPSAGTTTTAVELQDHLNAIGFTLVNGQNKVLAVTLFLNSTARRVHYFYGPNQAGTYGNGGTPINYTDLVFIGAGLETSDSEVSQVIDLGDIGASTIEAYIEALVGTTYVLEAGTIYQFKCVKDGEAENYLYTGALPNIIGDGGNEVTASDFYLLAPDTGGDGGGGDLLAVNNLSDLVSYAAAQVNLKLVPGVDVEKFLAVIAAGDISGAFDLDHTAKFWALKTMTADTTFTDSNRVVDGIARGLYLTGDFAPTWPSHWKASAASEAYDGAVVCRVTWDVLSTTTDPGAVSYTIEVDV